MEDDWDLHAVVRGCTTNSSASCSTSTTTATTFVSTTTVPPCENTHLSYVPQQDGNFLYMQDLYRRSGGSLEDLHDLYKPFFPKSSPPLSPQSIPISPLSVLGGLPDLSQQMQQIHHHQQQQQQQQQQISKPKQNFSLVGPCRNKSSHPQNSRSKRRKNQMKRVIEVPAEALSSDMWSWRKYGQKPIKGSPYPRGYYRCSTSKGCSARKQVERNRSDPGMFIVTYTAEHNHPMPTHRNSLAGSSRQKATTSSGEPSKPSNSSPPVSPSVGDSSEPEKLEIESCKDDVIEEDDENLVNGQEMNLDDDDFFEGLDELEAAAPAGISSSFSQKIELPWLTNSATTTAAGGV